MLRVTICAVGRLRGGPEAALVADYLARFDKSGRGIGLGPAAVREVDDRKPADALLHACPDGAVRVALDERGATPTSPDFARWLARWRDEGARDVAFLIGGADGLPRDTRADCDKALSFGPMVWPHVLARAMLAEQLYRAASILAGGPYHRA